MHGYNMVGWPSHGITWMLYVESLFVCLFVVVILKYNNQYELLWFSESLTKIMAWNEERWEVLNISNS